MYFVTTSHKRRRWFIIPKLGILNTNLHNYQIGYFASIYTRRCFNIIMIRIKKYVSHELQMFL